MKIILLGHCEVSFVERLSSSRRVLYQRFHHKLLTFFLLFPRLLSENRLEHIPDDVFMNKIDNENNNEENTLAVL